MGSEFQTQTKKDDGGGPRLEPIVGPPIAAVVLEGDGAVVLGRAPTCNGVLPHRTVSRRHAEFRRSGARWTLRDLGSRHGTIVNGTPVDRDSPTPVTSGDLVAIGPWTLRVSIPGSEHENGTSVTRGVSPGTASVDRSSHAERVEHLKYQPDAAIAQHRLTLLLQCASTLQGATSMAVLADAVVEAALEGSGFGRAALLRTAGDQRVAVDSSDTDPRIELLSARVAGSAGAGSAVSEPFSVSASLIEAASDGQAAKLSAMKGGKDTDFGESIDNLHIQEAICVPVVVGGVTEGFLYLDARVGERAAADDAGVYLAALAQLAGLAVADQRRREIARRHEALQIELSAAHSAQQLIVPPPRGRIGPARYSVRTRPGMVVAGDLFDILRLPSGEAAFFLGDVTGEGISAGMLMASAQGHLHASLLEHREPAAAVRAVNDYLASHTPPDRFITLWAGVLDHEKGELCYVDAGHGYAISIPRIGRPQIMPRGRGIPVAIEPGLPYEAQRIPFSPGDRVVLFSDGVIEQTQHAEDTATAADSRRGRGRRLDFGVDRVLDLLARSNTPEDDTRRVLAAVLDFAGTSALDDDTTIASIEWTPEGVETGEPASRSAEP